MTKMPSAAHENNRQWHERFKGDVAAFGVTTTLAGFICSTTAAVTIIIRFKHVETAESKIFIWSSNTCDFRKEQIVGDTVKFINSFSPCSEIEMIVPIILIGAALTN